MKTLLTFILLMVSASSCNVVSLKYHEPTPTEKENSLKMLHSVGFRGTILDVQNMGLKVRNHRLVIVSLDSITQNIINDSSLYCYKWDFLNRKLELIIKVGSLDYDSHVFEGYKLVKDGNSDKVKAYDEDGNFVKEFVVFE